MPFALLPLLALRIELRPTTPANMKTPPKQNPTIDFTRPATIENLIKNHIISQDISNLKRSKKPRLVRPLSQA